MKRTVKEWVNFLNHDNALFCFKKNNTSVAMCEYRYAEDFLDYIDGWEDDIVIKAYTPNLIKNGKEYFLFYY